MIVVTGAAGFIGSCLVSKLNQDGKTNLILVDDFTKLDKSRNWENSHYAKQIERSIFIDWFKNNADQVDGVYHIGARTDTTEFDETIFDELNVNYTKDIWNICSDASIPLIYASSGATYGLGEYGYVDDHNIVEKLKPLNPYGESKNNFDIWALKQEKQPPFWAGLKFFNVYGPNEYHKGRMASVIFHAYNQIKATEKMKLFQSHNPDYKDGEQIRDFVYVKDVVNVCLWLMENQPESALYNLGTGTARTFLDLANNTFKAMGKPADISFVPTPEDIRDKYQYFTEADMTKLKKAGYTQSFMTLEEGVADYVTNYLIPNKIY
ncbi:ADP-glyceromanno-heptose 6-epimerase [bacterium]|nr:ADP-glyceromanno-heptose 6-epimerase [bacterium]